MKDCSLSLPLLSILLCAVYIVNLWRGENCIVNSKQILLVNISELVEYSVASKDMKSLLTSSQLNSSDPFDANLFPSLCTSTETAVTGARFSEAAMAVKSTVQLCVFMPLLHY